MIAALGRLFGRRPVPSKPTPPTPRALSGDARLFEIGGKQLPASRVVVTVLEIENEAWSLDHWTEEDRDHLAFGLGPAPLVFAGPDRWTVILVSSRQYDKHEIVKAIGDHRRFRREMFFGVDVYDPKGNLACLRDTMGWELKS